MRDLCSAREVRLLAEWLRGGMAPWLEPYGIAPARVRRAWGLTQ